MKILKFLKLNNKEKKIIIEAFLYFFLSIVLVRFFNLNFYSKFIGKYMKPIDFNENISINDSDMKIAKNVFLVKKYFPIKTTCLEESIVLKKILASRKINSILYLGLKKEKNNLIAHAWITPSYFTSDRDFTPIACFK